MKETDICRCRIYSGNLQKFLPKWAVSFVSHFHASTGRPRKYQLYPMLKALLIQRIFSIPTDTLLIVFLKYSQELRDFCGFDVVPDGSKFTRFKQDFLKAFSCLIMRFAYLGLFSVTQASIPEVSKIVMEARAESRFWQIGSVRSTRWSNIDCKSDKKSCLKRVNLEPSGTTSKPYYQAAKGFQKVP